VCRCWKVFYRLSVSLLLTTKIMSGMVKYALYLAAARRGAEPGGEKIA
jgi:hypothetical protein